MTEPRRSPAISAAQAGDLTPALRAGDVTGIDVLIVFLGLLAGGVALLGLEWGAWFFDVELYSGQDERGWMLAAELAVYTGAMGAAWLRLRERWTLAAHWRLAPFHWWLIPAGICAGAVAIGIGIFLPWNELSHGPPGDPYSLAGGIAVSAIVGSIVSEIVCVRMLYGWLRQRVGIAWGVFLNSLLYAISLSVMGWFGFAFGFLCGIAAMLIYQVQGTLWIGIVAGATMGSVIEIAFYMGWL